MLKTNKSALERIYDDIKMGKADKQEFVQGVQNIIGEERERIVKDNYEVEEERGG